jgi:transcriptional regulator
MTNNPAERVELLQGTLDMLILRTLQFGPAHGHQIAKHIQRTTEDILQVEHGSLYPALHRLERKGWIAAKWESAGKDRDLRKPLWLLMGAIGAVMLIATTAFPQVVQPFESRCKEPRRPLTHAHRQRQIFRAVEIQNPGA